MRNVYDFNSDLYKQRFVFCPAHSASYFVKVVKEIAGIEFEELNFDDYDGWTVELNGTIFIWLSSKNKSILPSLAHECVHAAIYCLKARGVRINTNDEPIAYLVEWLFGKCVKHIKD